MCGLWGGHANVLTLIEKASIKTLGLMSQLRGTDSAGIAVVYEDWDKKLYHAHEKALGPSSNIVFEGRGKRLIEFYGAKLVAGHCRDATIGSVTLENAQPFYVGNITGMHNGTAAELEVKEDESDSAALFRLLDKEGIQKTVDKIKDSSYALCWIDKRDTTINFLRNSGRPLWFMEGGGATYWASDEDFLNFVRWRRPNALGEPMMLPVDQQLTINIRTGAKSKNEVKPNRTKIYQSSRVPETGDEKLVYKAYAGKRMAVQKASRLLNKGCAGCTTRVFLHEEAHWFSKKAYVCKKCSFNKEALGITGNLWQARLIREKR